MQACCDRRAYRQGTGLPQVLVASSAIPQLAVEQSDDVVLGERRDGFLRAGLEVNYLFPHQLRSLIRSQEHCEEAMVVPTKSCSD